MDSSGRSGFSLPINRMASAHRSRFFRIFNQFHYIPPSAIGIDFGSTNTTLSVPLRSFYPKANRSADSLLLALNCDGNNHTPTRLFYDPSTRNYFVGNASDNPRSLTGFKEALPSHLQHIAAFLHTLLSSLTGVDGLPPSLPSMPECAHISIVSIPPLLSHIAFLFRQLITLISFSLSLSTSLPIK